MLFFLFLSIMSENQILNFKLIFIGESEVGKTNIISRYINNTFSEIHRPLEGLGFTQKEIMINSKSITIDLWDTPAGKKFINLLKVFIRNAFGCIIISDETRKITREK